MHIAVSTFSLADSTPDALNRAAELGFSHVEINLDSDEFGYGYRRRPNVKFYRDLKTQLDQLGLQVWSITPPPLTPAQMFSPKARKDILLGSAGAGGILGARVFSAEPTHLFTNEDDLIAYFNEGGVPPIIAGFDETWAQVKNKRMTFAVQNQGHWLGQPLTNNPQRMKKLTFDLGIGCALDLPQAAKNAPLLEWLRELLDRIAVMSSYQTVDEQVVLVDGGDSAETLTQLTQTNLKCLILHGHPDEEDDTFRAILQSHRKRLNDLL